LVKRFEYLGYISDGRVIYCDVKEKITKEHKCYGILLPLMKWKTCLGTAKER
jgi:hypothetical protein